MSGEEYVPVDLSGLCNGHAASIAEMTGPIGAPSRLMVAAPIGRQRYRGLPFLIGRDGGGDEHRGQPEAEADAPAPSQQPGGRPSAS